MPPIPEVNSTEGEKAEARQQQGHNLVKKGGVIDNRMLMEPILPRQRHRIMEF
jgi:hypothetical protein